MKNLLIRADASPQIGTGHVMRCLALAQAWQDIGGTVTLASKSLGERLKRRIEVEKIGLVDIRAEDDREDATELAQLAHKDSSFVVLDGYRFGIVHQQVLRDAGIRHLLFDDYGHAKQYIADIVLNQNISPDEALYSNREDRTELLLGTRYALLRREFRKIVRPGIRRPSSPYRILVNFGGSDPKNLTALAVRALMPLLGNQTELKVLVGPENGQLPPIREAGALSKGITVLHDVAEVARLMDSCNSAISAAGSTVWELAYLGVPMFLVVTAPNQERTAEILRASDLAVVWNEDELGSGSAIEQLLAVLGSPERYIQYSSRLLQLVDGAGAERVCAAIRAKYD
jgi:UDP-2,4-diacetamido-2,4,6-trideoxy-beta-L-altropyranose hydrolase